MAVLEVSRHLGITDYTHYRWRGKYGWLKADQTKKLKELEILPQWVNTDLVAPAMSTSGRLNQRTKHKGTSQEEPIEVARAVAEHQVFGSGDDRCSAGSAQFVLAKCRMSVFTNMRRMFITGTLR